MRIAGAMMAVSGVPGRQVGEEEQAAFVGDEDYIDCVRLHPLLDELREMSDAKDAVRAPGHDGALRSQLDDHGGAVQPAAERSTVVRRHFEDQVGKQVP